MKIISKEEFLDDLKYYTQEIIKGKIFIFPTDTIYGIGCDATHSKSIKKIKIAKQRDVNKPISFIAPSKNWIKKYYYILVNHQKYLDTLPGAYTYILKRKSNCPISTEINPKNSQYDGIRIPDNWFYHDVISQINIPFCSTSANISGKVHITSIEHIEEEMKKYIDYVINEGEINGKPSTIINLVEDEPKILRK